MGKLRDLTGKRFGSLLVVKLLGRDKNRHSIWECLCDCGNTSTPIGDSLWRGHTKSCGCGESQFFKNLPPRNPAPPVEGKITGKYRIRGIYDNMLDRCYDPKCKNYSRYGGRGIFISDDWLGPGGSKKLP